MDQAENDFLSSLLHAMNADNASRLPDLPTPSVVKAASSTSASKAPSTSSEMGRLLEGADEWDWDDDLEGDTSLLDPETVVRGLDFHLQSTDEWLINFEPSRLPEKAKIPEVEKNALPPCTRCLVKSIEDSRHGIRWEKVLFVTFEKRGKDLHRVVLQGDWATTSVIPGDIINIIGAFEPSQDAAWASSITISPGGNLLILHPDLLITATAIANSSHCQRRPLISTLVTSSNDITPSLVWGNLLHEVVQLSLAEGRWDDQWINDKTDEIVRRNLDNLVQLNLSIDVAKAEIQKRAQGLQGFSRRFVGVNPKPDAVLTDSRAGRGQQSLLAIRGLHETEEDIWSPRYGLKGKLDASVQVVIKENQGAQKNCEQILNMPMEIKTGLAKGGAEHRAQTMLYTILMEERYGTKVPAGLLYYTQSDEVIKVTTARSELRALLQNRNNMASFLNKRSSSVKDSKDDQTSTVFLPPAESDERTCRKCYAVDGCMLYRKAVEAVEDTTSELAEIYASKTDHLTSSQCEFFKEWEALIALEEQEMLRFRRELWTMNAKDRERTGRCFANMRLVDTPPSLQTSSRVDSKIHRYTYTFKRRVLRPTLSPRKLTRVNSSPGRAASPTTTHVQATPDNPSLLSGHISVGDAITISIEPSMVAISRGYILQLEPDSIVVGVDKEINIPRLTNHTDTTDLGVSNASVLVFRLDKDELAAGIGRIRNNLAQLFYKGGDSRRLELVVDLKKPVFHDSQAKITAPHLNQSQKRAINNVLNAQDYAIILGMPGTGKTTTIAEIIKELVRRGKTVLLASYTHSAVDTILMKLLDADFGVLRLGNIDKVHPTVQKLSLASQSPPLSVGELEKRLLSPPVVATTCLSIDHALFSRRSFDVCIVDEASQITLPTCVGPLRFAKKFVLVGDHYQLPPLVKSSRARKGGFDVSLFRRLSEAHPDAVVELIEQYRMNDDIMKVSNRLIYSNRMLCGSESVAQQRLSIAQADPFKKLHKATGIECPGSSCWVQDIIDPIRSVVFVDTDRVPAKESRVGDLVQNETEAALMQQFVKALVQGGVDESQIGVISLYRQQNKLLSHLLETYRGVEVLTADRSQGRDKDCIVISMVRANDSNTIGDLLKDWRRLNVSFTRARKKLVFFGSRKTLDSTDLLRDFFKFIEQEGWIYALQAGAHLTHELKPALHNGKVRLSSTFDKENSPVSPKSPRKRQKIDKEILKSVIGMTAALRGRPILKDLVVDGQSL
ncbi:Tripartite DNA replication factor [Serendipita sp. 398]|nr:Tripartite DNA replication factor [Serendipita sp. 398]